MLVHPNSAARRASIPVQSTSRNRLAGRRAGVAAVEFAVILPFVMVLFLGIIEFGRVLMVQQMITNAAREGCRYAVLPGATISASRTVVTNYLSNAGITVSDPTNQISVSPDPSTASQGTSITVTVTIPCNSVSWLPTPIFMGGKQLSSTVVMRLESNNT